MLRPRHSRGASPLLANDALPVVLALVTVVGALVRPPLPWPHAVVAGAALLVIGWVRRRPVALVVGCFALVATLAGHAWSGAAPVPPASFAGPVTLRTDPAPLGPGVVATGASGGRLLELRAFGGSARRLRSLLAGHQLVVEGRIRPPPARQAAWLRSRHIVGVLEVTHVTVVGDGLGLARSANRVRGLLTRGARTMDPVDASLYLGFVVGDDRAQPRELVDTLRQAGLGHLSAVSGQNVALTLAVVSPVLRRLGHRARWAATLGVIGWFAVLTRFEPSVLRAGVMAAMAATAVLTGRPARPWRTLSLTVVIVLIVDPLLVRSVGWWLSVGATAGIALLAAPLSCRLPGPAWLRVPLSMTAAAQLGVAPVSLAVFGPVPLASLPANLLAAPAAGPVMVYGLPAGILAGLLSDAAAVVLQFPTTLLVRYIAGVATLAAAADLPGLGLPAVLASALGVALLLRRPPRHRQ
jgi:competence protein ComEC